MTDRSVTIIGAGLAGLSTGCYVQMNGYQSQIFEHHSKPGGVACGWRRGDYFIDGGIHFVMGHRPGTGLYELYRQLGVIPTVDFVDMTTYGRFIDEASGYDLVVTRDLDRLAADLKALSPVDAKIVDELVASARSMQGFDMSTVGLSKPPELAGRLDQVKELWSMRRLMRFFVGKFAQPVAQYASAAQNPVLRTCLEGLFLPEVPVFFISMILAMMADGQLAFIDGSCVDFVRAIERRYLELGGKITYDARVEEILAEAGAPGAENDRAVGVRLSRRAPPPRERRAGAVVSAADGYGTIFGMLAGRYADDKIRQRYEHWPRFSPLLTISYGVEREFTTEPTFVTIRLDDPIRVAGQTIQSVFLRFSNYSSRFAPPGKTVVQVEIETKWDYWNDLHRENRAAYEEEKERVAAEVLDRLDRHYPGIAESVEVTDVATPFTWWRYTLNDRGAWEGWLMSPEMMTKKVERTLPGLEDFYMAGQWVMPGGGVPPVLYSGQHAVQLLCRRDGKRFVTAKS